jgi:hypothetical protein
VVWCASTASMTPGLGGMVQQGADVRRGLMDSHMAGEPCGVVVGSPSERLCFIIISYIWVGGKWWITGA